MKKTEAERSSVTGKMGEEEEEEEARGKNIMVAGEVGWCTIDGYRVGELVREIIRRARACRWKPHAALFKLNPVRIIIGGQLGPSRLIPRDRIYEYEEEKRSREAEDAEARERERSKRSRRRGSRVVEKRERTREGRGGNEGGGGDERRNGWESEEVR